MDKIKQINKCCASIKKEIELFENALKKIINKDRNFLSKDLDNFLFNNPKRLRVRFILLFAKMFEIKSPLVLKIALIVELIHSASLIHDDIIDCDELRRKNPTFYKKYGPKIAVLEGDFLLSLALVELSKTNNKITSIFSKKIKKTIQGEILQNEILGKIPNYKTYLSKTINKTANLFLAGLEALLTLKEINEQEKTAALDFMKNYSIAFQIKNDIENFEKFSDYKNGNYTLPMIYFDKEKEKKDISKQTIKKYLKKAQNKVQQYQTKALLNLDKIKNKNKDSIIQLLKTTLRS